MRSQADVEAVFALASAGKPHAEISRQTGVSRSQVRAWLADGIEAVRRSHSRSETIHEGAACPLVAMVDRRPYAYLFGQYLGDGCISSTHNRTMKLRITTCDAYPVIRAECIAAVAAVLPANRVGQAQRQGCTDVVVYSRHLPCLFPQHAPGSKHTRAIRLQEWQHSICLGDHPALFLRGLIHADGCRCINRIVRHFPSGDRTYEYPRYLFTNENADILDLFSEACARVGVEVRPNRRNSLSVARRSSVSRLDEFVGPKR